MNRFQFWFKGDIGYSFVNEVVALMTFHKNDCSCVTTVSVCVLSSKMCAGPMQRLVRAAPCCPAGTLTAGRAAVLSLSTAAAGGTGITLSQRSTAYLSAAASVSPAGSST